MLLRKQRQHSPENDTRTISHQPIAISSAITWRSPGLRSSEIIYIPPSTVRVSLQRKCSLISCLKHALCGESEKPEETMSALPLAHNDCEQQLYTTRAEQSIGCSFHTRTRRMGELQMAIAEARRSREDLAQRSNTDFGRDKAWQLWDQERCAYWSRLAHDFHTRILSRSAFPASRVRGGHTVDG